MKIIKEDSKKNKLCSNDEKKKTPNTKRRIMYVTQINRMPFYDSEKDELDYNALTEVLKDNLKSESGYKWAYVVHDLDYLEDGSKKPKHIHLIVQNQKGISMNLLKSILQDDNLNNYEYLHGYFKAAEMYIIHDTEQAKKDKKHLYDEHSIIANYDYVSEIKRHRENREKSAKKKAKKDYINMILTGKLTKNDFLSFKTDKDKELARFYADNKKKVDDAFSVRNSIELKEYHKEKMGEYGKEYERFKLIKNSDEKVILWLYGESGKGKSLLSKLLAKLYSDKPEDIYFSSSNNDIFQNYSNEKIVVLEELRANALNIEDMFRLLDKDKVVSIKRRYHNVSVRAEVIIINSILSPYDFFLKSINKNCNLNSEISKAMTLLKGIEDDGEPFEQLNRRITSVIEVDGVYKSFDENDYLTCKSFEVNLLEKTFVYPNAGNGKEYKTFVYDPDECFSLFISEDYKNVVGSHRDFYRLKGEYKEFKNIKPYDVFEPYYKIKNIEELKREYKKTSNKS